MQTCIVNTNKYLYNHFFSEDSKYVCNTEHGKYVNSIIETELS